VLTVDGKIYAGPGNVECANYTLTKHAEETALLVAIADGAMIDVTHKRRRRKFVRAVYLPTVEGKAVHPCGGCRQFIWEFSDDEAVFIVELPEGREQITRVRDSLPQPFGPADLGIEDTDSPP
jgi:cytidine deaminase